MTNKIKAPSKRTVKYNEANIRLLVGQFKSGNRKSFAGIWDAVRPLIYRLMLRGLDKNTASDLTGDVCVQLYERGISEYDQEKCSFITWVYQITLNRKADEFKRFKPLFFSQMGRRDDEKTNEKAHIKVIDNQRSDNRTPLSILIEREENDIRLKALKLLPELLALLSPDEQYLIYASIYENRGDEETALILDGENACPETRKKMRQRALKKLGRLFVEHGIRSVPLKI